MSRFLHAAVLACGVSGICCAAHCTTAINPAILREYDHYVTAAEQAMPSRFDSGELAWVPDRARRESAAELAAGKLVRWNIGDAALNARLAAQNGAVIHWVGAIRIRRASLANLRSVLEDYGSYDRIYRPMIYACKAKRMRDAPNAVYDVTFGLRSAFRFASLIPQHYAFQVKARIDYRVDSIDRLDVHLGASEIRESDSGESGHADLLETYHDHGIMWAMNEYWRARQRGPDVYLEFESITLARSVQAFACKIGIVPVPKAIVSAAMESLPADTLAVILEATKAECEHRASGL